MLDENAKATLEYGGNGKANLTIISADGTVVCKQEVEAEDCRNVWGSFSIGIETFKFNFFDDPNDYGVGCWVYPNGDESNELTLDVEIYEHGKLARKNQ